MSGLVQPLALISALRRKKPQRLPLFLACLRKQVPYTAECPRPYDWTWLYVLCKNNLCFGREHPIITLTHTMRNGR